MNPNLINALDLASFPEPEWLLPGWFYRGSLTLLTSDPGVGKSSLATALGLAVACGTPFLSSPPAPPGRVIYCALDAPAWDYARILRKIGPPPDPGTGPDALYAPSLLYTFSRPSLTADGMESFLSYASWAFGPPPDLLIIDTLRKVHDFNENDSLEMTRLCSSLRTITRKGTAVCLLTHTAIAQLGRPAAYAARGSSVVAGEVDSHLVLSGKKLSPGHSKITGRWVKGRGGSFEPTFHYYLSWTDSTMSFSLTPPDSAVPDPVSGRRRVLSLLPAPLSTIASSLSISRQAVHRHLTAAGCHRTADGLWHLAPGSAVPGGDA